MKGFGVQAVVAAKHVAWTFRVWAGARIGFSGLPACL
jgi:hypothetical protein